MEGAQDEESIPELQFKVEQHIASLKTNEQNTSALRALVELYAKLDNFPKAREAVEQLFLCYEDNPKLPTDELLRIVDDVVNYWKIDKYSKKGSLRLNISEDRKSILRRATNILESIMPIVPSTRKQELQITLATYRENLGRFPDALAICSDLIAVQATDIDLTLVIFKAAVLLMHIGGNNTQAIEYLEFLTDEPPEADGYGRTHILACLAALYERSGDHYAVVLEQTYQALQDNYSKDLEKGKKPVTNQKKLQEQLTRKAFSRSSEIWEILAVQAVDRCDYVFAVLLAKKAIEKCPSKGSLSHLLAELQYLLGDIEGSIKSAERAFQLNPQSAELKNLLLLVNPEKWQDRMRTVAASREEVIVEDDIDHADTRGGKKHAATRAKEDPTKKDQSWLTRITSTATEAVKDGLLAVANAKSNAEQRAKAAAEKERKRRERKEKKEKEAAEKEAKIKAMASMGLLLTADGKPRKRDVFLDGPAKPDKPDDLEAAKPMLEIIRSGNENVYLYDPILIQLASIQEQIKREEMAWVERKKKAKQKEKDAAGVATTPSKAISTKFTPRTAT